MTRKFTQRHYFALADILIEAVREARAGDPGGLNGDNRIEGVHIVHELLVRALTRDAREFDVQKFDRYIGNTLSKAAS